MVVLLRDRVPGAGPASSQGFDHLQRAVAGCVASVLRQFHYSYLIRI